MRKFILFFILLNSSISNIQSQEQTVESVFPELLKQFPAIRDFTILETNNEAYFTAQSYMGELSSIVKVIKEHGQWKLDGIAPFSGKYQDLEPFLSPDGLRLYFASNRPLSGGTAHKDYDIWYVERKKISSPWSKPINLGKPINTEEDEFYPILTLSGALYFTSVGKGSKGKDDIFYSEYNDGTYKAPISLEREINSEGYEFNAYIDPEEKYMIYTTYNRKGGYGSGDLMISYKKNEKWTIAKNMGELINTTKMEYCPFVDVKNKMLYFTSKRNYIKPEKTQFDSIPQMLEIMNRYENGLSRIYKVSIKNFIE